MELLKKTIKNLYKTIFMIILSSLIISLFNVLLSKCIIYIIDGIIMEKSIIPIYFKIFFSSNTKISKIFVIAIFMLIMVLIISIFTYIRDKFNTKLKLGMNKNIKLLLLKHSTNLSYKSYHTYENNEILQRISVDANSYVTYINEKLNLILNTFFYTFFSLSVIVNLNFKICLILSTIILLILIMSIWYCIKTKNIVNRKVKLSEILIKKILHVAYNYKMIKMTNNQENEIKKFNISSEKYLKYDKKEIDYLIYYELIASGLKELSIPIIYLVCGIAIIKGNMQIGSLMAILTYCKNILNYFQNLIFAIEGINNFLIPAKRIQNFLKLDEENFSLNNLNLEKYQNIVFKNVSVKIDEQIIFENASFEINKGEQVYIVGANGSGKSIFAKLFLGFIPYEGSIKIDGVELNKINLLNLRNNIGLCFQQPYIFSESIKNNIDCFENNDLNDIKNAIKISEIEEEIENLPNKYNETLEENGKNLSGGQKQRINIARLIMQNKKILIFDDVLSKIDNNTKEKIIKNIKNYDSNIINLYITHDILNISNSSRVLFIDNKKIIDSSNKNLKKANDNYKKLVNICENAVGGIYE